MPAKRKGSNTPSRRWRSIGLSDTNASSPSSQSPRRQRKAASTQQKIDDNSLISNKTTTVAAFESQKALVSQYIESLVTDTVADPEGEAILSSQRQRIAGSKSVREEEGEEAAATKDNREEENDDDDDDDAVVLDVMAATTAGLPAKDRIKEACRTLTSRVKGRLLDISHSHANAIEALEQQLINDEFMVLKEMTDDFAEGVDMWCQQAKDVVRHLSEEQTHLRGFVEATQIKLRERREAFELENKLRSEQLERDIVKMLAESEEALADVLPPESRQASISLGRTSAAQNNNNVGGVSAAPPSNSLMRDATAAFPSLRPGEVPNRYGSVSSMAPLPPSNVSGGLAMSTPLHPTASTSNYLMNGGGGGEGGDASSVRYMPPPHNALHTAPRSAAPSIARREAEEKAIMMLAAEAAERREAGNNSSVSNATSYSLPHPSLSNSLRTSPAAAQTAAHHPSHAAASKENPSRSVSVSGGHYNKTNTSAAPSHRGGGGAASSAVKSYPGATERRFATLHPSATAATTIASAPLGNSAGGPTQAPPSAQHSASAHMPTASVNKSLSMVAARSASRLSPAMAGGGGGGGRGGGMGAASARKSPSVLATAAAEEEGVIPLSRKQSQQAILNANDKSAAAGGRSVSQSQQNMNNKNNSQRRVSPQLVDGSRGGNLLQNPQLNQNTAASNSVNNNNSNNPFFAHSANSASNQRAESAPMNVAGVATTAGSSVSGSLGIGTAQRVVAQTLLPKFDEETELAHQAKANPNKTSNVAPNSSSSPAAFLSSQKKDLSKVKPISLRELFGEGSASPPPPTASQKGGRRVGGKR